jgi:hypothetical protein
VCVPVGSARIAQGGAQQHGDHEASIAGCQQRILAAIRPVNCGLPQALIELSDGVAFFAAVAGVGVVLVQVLAYAAHTSAGVAPAEEPKDVVDEAKDVDATTTENPATSFVNEGY